MKKIISFLSLFGSLGTLLCCALPVLFVSLGIGGLFASMTASFPQIRWITQYKTTLFIITGILLAISFFLMRNARNLSCPIEPGAKEACQTAKPITKWMFYFSVTIYGIGILFSYVLPKLMYG